MGDHPAHPAAEGGDAGHAHASPEQVYESSKLGLWTFIATEVLLFGGLFATFIVFRLRYPEMFRADFAHLNRVMGAINTVVLICSSLTVALGIAAIRKGKQDLLKLCLSLTILLAGAFLVVKYFEWTEKFHHGLFPSTDIFFSLYFMMTGVHALHVLGGMLILGAMLALAAKGKFTAQYHTPVELSGLYWHFVDLVWIYLFPLFYLMG